ncbi:hypothetical protein SNE40_016582 [Patella caerulea]|uniref:Microtubule-associated protein Jupiter n=1 Tax=Patella caerulea TaxID=87958 RepID=A0AAN8JEL0_PATCE
MTSTGINQGLGDEQKPTSRVLRPPGGGASNIFGGEADPPPKRQSQRAHVSQQPSQGQTKKLFGESDHVEKILPQTRGFYNPITGEAYEKTACSAPPPKPKPVDNYQPLPSAGDGPGVMQSTSGKAQDVRTSSRVLNPPGGPTTKLW